MRTAALAVLYALVLGAGFDARQQHVTDPEWIAVYELKRDETREPLLNIRVVIRAKSEGEAVMKSTIYLQSKFGVNVTETLQFVEVARREERKK